MFGLLALATAITGEWTPSLDVIRKVEAQLVLPRKAKPLASYARFYAGVMRDGRPVVEAILHVGWHNDVPEVHVVPEAELPNIMDGGCSVLRFSFDPETGIAGPVRCHGVA